MTAKDFIVVIELGSSHITGLAGKKNDDGSMEILASIQHDAQGCIQYGNIYNSDKTCEIIRSIIQQIETQLNAKIHKAYVGIGGLSLHSELQTIPLDLGIEQKIKQEHIDNLADTNAMNEIPRYRIQEVIPQEFKIGVNTTNNPIGIQARNILGNYLNIVSWKISTSNIEECFEQAGIQVADEIVAPIALANILLKSDEKRTGCVLVDLGAHTTTVMVYKGNLLRHLCVIPLGSAHITNDIASTDIDFLDAEQLKKQYGKAYTPFGTEYNDNESYILDNGISISQRLLDEIVEARFSEILDNINHQIEKTPYKGKLPGGIVFTGNGARLNCIYEAVQNKFNIGTIRFDISNDVSFVAKGLLAAGTETCGTIQVKTETVTPVKRPEIEIPVVDPNLLAEYNKITNNIRKAIAKKDIKKAKNLIKKAYKLKLPNTENELGGFEYEVNNMQGTPSLFEKIKTKIDQMTTDENF